MKTQTQSEQSGIRRVVVLNNPSRSVLRAIDVSQKVSAVTVNQAVSQWLSWAAEHTSANTFAASRSYVNAWSRDAGTGSIPVRDIQTEHIGGWINDADSNAKLGTRKVKLSVLRSFFTFCSIKGLLDGPDPSRLVKVKYNLMSHEQKESHETMTFTDEEIGRLVGHIESELHEIQPKIEQAKSAVVKHRLEVRRDAALFWKCAVVIARCAGLRLGDICQLEWACFGGKKFAVWTDKRDKRVEPFIWNELLFDDAVASIPTDSTERCFPRIRVIYLNPKRRASLSMQFSRLCRRLKMAGHTFHGLRHTYATECDKSGIPTPHIARSMGHSSTRTTESYIHE